MCAVIHLCLAHLSGQEEAFIHEAFTSNWVTSLGPNVDRFEGLLEQYLHGNRKVCAVASGTAAVHLALILTGVGAGDEVLCQSFTFAASANPIVYQGAMPIFIDSEPDTWNLDPGLLEQAIVERKCLTGHYPKAIISVALYGMPAKMHELVAVAQRYNIPLIEDSAEAMGSTYAGQACGTFGDFGIWSFNGNKMITTSGGGALICRSEEVKRQAIFLATQAREPAPYYQHERIGYNYRLSNISASIGCGQMAVVDAHVAHHRHLHDLYTRLLADVAGISVHQAPGSEFASNFWLTTILVQPELFGIDCDALRMHLEQHGIESRRLWKPLHLQPVFHAALRYTNGISEQLFNSGLCLPSGPCVSDADAERIVTEIKRCPR
jgi:dTDP-4-amino-4,6-dideoxygalactose transaminase